jgi:hypothetical protein
MTSIQNTSNLYYLSVFRLLFAVLRPVKHKYKLSVNELMILNSCYLYSKLAKPEFYLTDIKKFNAYYNEIRCKYYFGTLFSKGLLSCVNPNDRRVRYIITLAGINVINELEEHYNSELYAFSNKYHLDL